MLQTEPPRFRLKKFIHLIKTVYFTIVFLVIFTGMWPPVYSFVSGTIYLVRQLVR